MFYNSDFVNNLVILHYTSIYVVRLKVKKNNF